MTDRKYSLLHTIDMMRQFTKMEIFAGLLLMLSGILALILANSPLSPFYNALIDLKLTVGVGNLILSKPLLLWVNDGLMTLFFLLIGLELKREFLEGQLSQISQVILPGIAAIGGITVPALIFIFFNYTDRTTILGWAIPTATDIAFSLGALALLGTRIPTSLKIFLMTLAIFDDLAAIVFIAIFYTSTLSTSSLLLAACAIVLLFILNCLNIKHVPLYLFVGLILWWFVLKSGVHATLAGVVIAFTIPLKIKDKNYPSPLEETEKMLHKWVAYLILPLFAFANSGISIGSVTLNTLTNPLTVGIVLGLFLGKQMGIFLFSYVLIKFKLASLPSETNFMQLYGISILCGIGFTMSLFISSLAFEHVDIIYTTMSRIGIFIGSTLSLIAGLLILKLSFPNNR